MNPPVGWKTRQRSTIAIFLSQFKNWLLILLIIAALIAYFLGEKINTLVILAIVLLSGLFSFFQEYKAERMVEKLKKLITNRAKVLRDNQWQEIDSRLLVVGDIVSLRVGDRVPADLHLLTVDNLSIDESLLTGESAPVFKSIIIWIGAVLTGYFFATEIVKQFFFRRFEY